MNYNKFFITTAIPYINAPAHIGHSQEFFLADTLAQILKNQGHQVILQSGTDDNSLKNVLSAQKLNIPLHEYLSEQGDKFKSLLNQLRITPDLFVQTSHLKHHKAVKKLISNLNPNDLYHDTYKGQYCVGCEDFVKPEDLVNNLCPDHLVAPNDIVESNIFFKLSKYQEQIFQLIESDTIKIFPESRKNEILNFIDKGLHDISISRPKKGNSYGIDFPHQQDQVVYVWIDALINYLTGIGYGEDDEWIKTWNDSYKIHVIGKNVWKFHCIYWIGLLLSSGINPPNEIIIHGFLTNDGVKISKSLGNAIDPLSVIQDFSPSVLRTYLLGKLNYLGDGDFKQSELKNFYLQELVNQVGNIFPRVFTLSQKFNFNLEFKPISVSTDFRDTKGLYEQLLLKTQGLNKAVNDSLIWTKSPSPEVFQLLTQWNQDLNDVASLLVVFFPELKDNIKKSFTEKTILFKKPVV